MRAFPAALAAVTSVSLLAIAAPQALATQDLQGRWVSDSLRDNRIGYYLVLRDTPGRAPGYVGHLRFQRQDGSREDRMPVTVTLVGDEVVITARERFDRAGRTMRGALDGEGTLVLTNCLDRLRLVMSWDLASDCTLRLQR
ncbi:MAG: hypothetical protein RL134_1581 [Actinomycetota bacterium]|jgi:hypothetical protein